MKKIHLSINDVNYLTACRVYSKFSTTDIRKVTCDKCQDRISNIYCVRGDVDKLTKIIEKLKKEIDSLEKFAGE